MCVWSLRLCVLLFFIWHYHETAKEMSSGSECVTSLQSDLSCWHTESRADSAERDSLSSGGVRRFFFSVSEESLWAPPPILHSSFHTYIQLLFSAFYCCLEFFFALKEKQNELKQKRKNTHKCHSVLMKLQLLSIQRPFSVGVTWPAHLLSPFQLWVLVASPSQLTFFRVFICHRLNSFSFI